NMDYPFNLKGILYFPKINMEYESIEGVIKLYNNQVFVADNIKEVIPEYLMLLKGAIDCPDFPLNVSRSALQNDGFVRKISDYISKKVADKLSGMYKVDREDYEKYWDDISPFIKFGCLKDDKFNDKMKDSIIYKNLEGKYITLDEYIEATKSKETKSDEDSKQEAVDKENISSDEKASSEEKASSKDSTADTKDDKGDKEEDKTVVYYVTDEKQQSQYINMFKEVGIDALILKHNIDQPFITHVEYKNQKVKFQGIDTEITDGFRVETKKKEQKILKNNSDAMTKLFRKTLAKDKLEVKVEKLKNDKVSSMITLSEEGRRMQDMMRMYNIPGMDANMAGEGETLVLNANHELVQYIITNEKSEHTPLICQQLYDLANLSHKPLEPEAMTKFIQRSNEIMMLLAK
ncbi:MAG: molecular chaperone HtpG, partial [Clostridiales bacterium]|nr:molecular chaperone HtpG [Clostridiales bacterium]